MACVTTLLLMLSASAANAPAAGFDAPAGTLTLQQAIDAALAASPRLTPFAWELRAADARLAQARRYPNPRVALEIENIRLGSSTTNRTTQVGLGYLPQDGPAYTFARERETLEGGGLAEVEATLRLSQVILLGGKRAAAIAAAASEQEVARWDYEVARTSVIGEAVQRFVAVLGSQARVEQHAALVALGGQLRDTVAARVEAGSVSPLESRRAIVELAGLELDHETAAAELERARLRLAATWGASEALFDRAFGALEPLPGLPELNRLLAQREAHPELARWNAELARRNAGVRAARAAGVPDLEITLGYRAAAVPESRIRGYALGSDGISGNWGEVRPEDDVAQSLVLEASIDLPIFNRNQGGIREAEALALQAADERKAALSALTAAIVDTHAGADAARATVERLESEIVPELSAAFALTQDGYRLGKFGFLDVLEAERALVEAKFRETEARIAYHAAFADLEQIIGAAIVPRTSMSEETQ